MTAATPDVPTIPRRISVSPRFDHGIDEYRFFYRITDDGVTGRATGDGDQHRHDDGHDQLFDDRYRGHVDPAVEEGDDERNEPDAGDADDDQCSRRECRIATGEGGRHRRHEFGRDCAEDAESDRQSGDSPSPRATANVKTVS